MAQGSRPARVGEQLRQTLAELLARDVHDPGIGFVTLTQVKVSPDLQMARVSYTLLGDPAARKDTEKALGRATPFLRRAIAQRLRLRRVPELTFHFDESVENQARIERILIDLADERQTRQAADADSAAPDTPGPAEPDSNSNPNRGPNEDPDKDPS